MLTKTILALGLTFTFLAITSLSQTVEDVQPLLNTEEEPEVLPTENEHIYTTQSPLNIEIFSNETVLELIVNCLTENQSCDLIQSEIKDYFPEAVKNGCSLCDDKLKEAFSTIIHHLMTEHLDLWNKMVEKYDLHEDDIDSLRDIYVTST